MSITSITLRLNVTKRHCRWLLQKGPSFIGWFLKAIVFQALQKSFFEHPSFLKTEQFVFARIELMIVTLIVEAWGVLVAILAIRKALKNMFHF